MPIAYSAALLLRLGLCDPIGNALAIRRARGRASTTSVGLHRFQELRSRPRKRRLLVELAECAEAVLFKQALAVNRFDSGLIVP